MNEETPMNIYQRINAVMKEVEYVQKDATITGAGSYKAVTHDNVTAVLRPLLVKYGIVVGVEQAKGKILQMRDVAQSIKMHLYKGDYIVSFINMDNPEDKHSVRVQAHSTDSGDKSPGKAMSMATKYSMLKTFSIETGENEEGRYHEADPYTPEQFAEFHELIAGEQAYDFYTFSATLAGDTGNALFNSFPEGKKTQGKKQARELEKAGKDLFDGVVDDINSRLDDHDISVLELTDEMDAMQKRLLMTRLSQPAIQQLQKIKEASL